MRKLIVRTWKISAAVLVFCSAGCATKPQPSDNAPASSGRSSDVITAAELSEQSLSTGDALEAVRRLRPRYLVKRGATSIRIPDAGTAHVSIDGGALQAVSVLSRMRPSEIAEIRFLNSSDAAQRFGTAAGAGAVLMVKMR